MKREKTTLSSDNVNLKNDNDTLEHTNYDLNRDNDKVSREIKEDIIQKLKDGNINNIITDGNNVKIQSGQDASFIKGLFEAYLPNVLINNLSQSQLGNALYNLLSKPAVKKPLKVSDDVAQDTIRGVHDRFKK
jgi:hypothetical protein